MTQTPDEMFGGGFSEVRDGATIEPVLRPETQEPPPEVGGGSRG